MDEITKEIEQVAAKLEKSATATTFSRDLIKSTVLRLGAEGLKKALPRLSADQKALLGEVLEDMAKGGPGSGRKGHTTAKKQEPRYANHEARQASLEDPELHKKTGNIDHVETGDEVEYRKRKYHVVGRGQHHAELHEVDEKGQKLQPTKSESVENFQRHIYPHDEFKHYPHNNIAKSHRELIAADKSVTTEPASNSTPSGDYRHNEDEKEEQDDQDEKLVEEATKRGQGEHKAQGGGAPVAGWSGQIIKSGTPKAAERVPNVATEAAKEAVTQVENEKCSHGLMKSDNCMKCMNKSEGANKMDGNMTLDEKKAAAAKNIKAMVARMQERKLEKSVCVAQLAKSLNAPAAALGEIWDQLQKATLVKDGGSNVNGLKTNPEGEQSDVPSQMKDEENGESKGKVPGMPEYEDKAAERMEDSGKPLSGKAAETADEMTAKVPMHKSEVSFWWQEPDCYLAKSANPFAQRSTGQNVSYRVDELIALQDASQNQRLAKSTFDYQSDEDVAASLAKGAFKKLEHKLEEEGKSEESAGAIAAAVGDKKYGKRSMERHAAEGKPLAKGEQNEAEQATERAEDENRRNVREAKKNEAEEIRQIKTDEKLSRIEGQGQKMPLVKSNKPQPTALNDLIEKGLDLTQSDVLVAQGNLARRNQGACLVKSFADDEMDALFKPQNMWAEGLIKSAGEGSRGGKIIGHTKSGKPIYAGGKGHEANHGHFGHLDHIEAGDFHFKEREKHYKKYQAAKEKGDSTAADKHQDYFNYHTGAGAYHNAKVNGVGYHHSVGDAKAAPWAAAADEDAYKIENKHGGFKEAKAPKK